jgi:putative RNA 2'-phosphotransferase
VHVRRTSKRLSYVLRHAPASAGLTLDRGGWVDVELLLAALGLTRDELDEVVRTNDKRRFAFDPSGTRIRASQGHSVDVALGYAATPPPDVLFHGTPARNLPAIRREGLRPGGRHAVHLSAEARTAAVVGARRGEHVVLRVDAGRMAADGWSFTLSANGVWLVDTVPPEYLEPQPSCTASTHST